MSDLVSEQAKRLKKIRLYLGMTREEFSKVIASSPFTIRSWENGQKHFGEKAVKKIISELTKIGFACTFDWMMYGKGISPISLFEANAESKDSSCMAVREGGADNPLVNEVYAIKAAFPGINIVNVNDDCYKPLAHKGDFLGFKEIPTDQLHYWQNHIVFYITHTGAKGFGTVKYHDELTIHPLDRATPLNSNDMQNVHEIVWYRKS
jgi:DNA-binding XRE family transcriptional regulator